jgi:hypothetical protein
MPAPGRLMSLVLPLLVMSLTVLLPEVSASAADAPPAADVSPAVPSPAGDDDIRAAFAGKAACPPQPWAVGVGPFEFRPDGAYFRAQDLASAHGRYAIAGGKICVTLTGSDKPDFCLAVLKDAGGYAFRLDESAALASGHTPVRVVPCDLPAPAAR